MTGIGRLQAVPGHRAGTQSAGPPLVVASTPSTLCQSLDAQTCCLQLRLPTVYPTPFDRTLWIVSRASAPVLGLAIIWLLLGVVRAVRAGDPFTRASARRLTVLAGTVAAGGIGVNVLGEMADNILLARSVLSSVVAIDAMLSFIPLAAGALIGEGNDGIVNG